MRFKQCRDCGLSYPLCKFTEYCMCGHDLVEKRGRSKRPESDEARVLLLLSEGAKRKPELVRALAFVLSAEQIDVIISALVERDSAYLESGCVTLTNKGRDAAFAVLNRHVYKKGREVMNELQHKKEEDVLELFKGV